MFKQLKIYYILVTLPFALLLIGSAVFIDAIKSTIIRNPHPQINFAIFVIILVGGTLIILSADRLIHEAKILLEFCGAMRAKKSLATLQEIANRHIGDISCLLQIVAASSNRSISHQEQSAIEHELTNAREHLIRRNALPQYLTGLLVGMGLLGTFIGLLSTLNNISVLIGSFADLDINNASPILVFRTMIERMKAPMQSMGIAFSASMFGLLGSITLGLMMVGIRRLQGDIISLLGSEIARHIENALSHEDITVESRNASGGDEFKVLVRIEERLAEAARMQQRMLSTEIDDFQKQRADMLRALTEQTGANNNFRNELQQVRRQLGSILTMLENDNKEISSQISDQTVHMAGNAKESHKLLALQLEEQKRLRDSLDSYNIEEWLAETTRVQQRILTSEIDDFQKQRADMLQALTEQTEANNNSLNEMKQLGRQLGSIFNYMEKGNSELLNQITELMVHRAADAKESHKLLAMQVNEQKRLCENLDWRNTGNSP